LKKTLVISFLLILILISSVSIFAQNEVDPWQQAKDSGVEFRAVGNDPSWWVEITGESSIKFVNHSGELEIKVPVDDVWLGPEGEDKIYYIENEVIPFQVILMKKEYQDTISGEVYPYQVRVIFPELSYIGGGRMLN